MATRILRRLRDLLDVNAGAIADGETLVWDDVAEEFVPGTAGGDGGGGAPTDVDYLVGTASGDLSAEIVVGTSPGGELGGTWESPTVDAVHSGSSHAAVQAAAEATAAAALSAHLTDTSDAHDASAISSVAAGNLASTDVQAALNELDTEKAATVHAHAGEDITSGTVADARIASTIARDSEVTAAVAALSSVYQPLDSDLTSIAALTTTSFGRTLLELANAAAFRTAGGLVIGTDVEAHDADLTTIAGLTPANDDVLQRKGGVWANRTIAQLLVDLAAPGTTFQPLDSDLTAIAALTTTTFGRSLLALADAAAARTNLGIPVLGGNAPGKWYGPWLGGTYANFAGTLNRLYAVPFFSNGGTYDRIAVWQNSGSTAGETVQLGIYADSGNGYPGALILDAGNVSVATAGLKSITISQVIPAGLNWLAVARQGSVVNSIIGTTIGSNPVTPPFVPASDQATPHFYDEARFAFYRDSVSGSLPSPWGATLTTVGATAGVWVRST